jgi:hypothetical protein
MRGVVLVLGALAAGCGQGVAGSSDGSHVAATTVSARGVSIAVPDGWQANASPGHIEIQDYDGHGDPIAGEVQASLSEYSQTLAAEDGFAYPELDGRLTIRPDEYPSAQFAKDAEEIPGVTGAARFFTVSGRLFELYARYGGDPPPTDSVARLNEILRTLRVQPGDFFPGTLDPPAFTPTAGWQVGGDTPTGARPEGDQLCAWASTIPYRDPQNCPIAAYTIDALPVDGMVISVNIYRNWSLPNDQLPQKLTLPAQLGPPGEGGRRSLDISGMSPGGYYVDISVNIAADATLTPTMRSRAQAMVDSLRPPSWPP